MTEAADFCDMRVLTPRELSMVILDQRQQRGWTQATLAELSGLTERTVQRVESGEPSSVDTRRALARSFQWQDIDVFNKPWPIPNVERLKAEKERLERETVAVTVVPFTRGRQAREMAEAAQAASFHAFGDLSVQAETVWARMQDYLRDYADADDCYTATEKLQVNEDLQEMMDALSAADLAIGGGTRRVSVTFPLAPKEGTAPLRLTVAYFVVCSAKAFPTTIRVPRTGAVGP